MCATPALCKICTKGGSVLELGMYFKKMRKGAGLSQESLAEKLHMSRSNVSRIESNKLKLTFEDAIRWAHNTSSQDMLAALIVNIDLINGLRPALQLITGTIIRGGLL